MKQAANILSAARIVLVLALLFIKLLSPLFYTVYILCGISDMADGYVARKTNTASSFGEKLDSIADFIMILVLVILLYPYVNPPEWVLVWIVVIAVFRAASVTVVFIKFKTFGMLHTYGNKITGFALFVYPLLLAVFSSDILTGIACILASISAAEELIIVLSSKKWQANRKSLFTA